MLIFRKQFLLCKNLFSLFLYRFAKSISASKIREHARLIAVCYDAFVVCIAWVLASYILANTIQDATNIYSEKTKILLIYSYWKPILLTLFYILPLQILLFRLIGLYRGFWRFASIQDLIKIFYTSLLGAIIVWIILRVNTTSEVLGITRHFYINLNIFSLIPHSILSALYSIFLIIFLSFARLLVRLAKDYKHLYDDYQRVIIVGAGSAGEWLVRNLLRDGNHRYKPIAFVDDDLSKRGREIHNIRVLGTTTELLFLIKKYNIDLVLIAIPSASSANIRSVVEICEKANIRCYILPGIKDLTNGYVSINTLRHISLEDLLGRYPVQCNLEEIYQYLQEKIVLVTGGGGSIGSELCRQILTSGKVNQLIIIDHHEYNLYAIDMELKEKFPACQIYPILLNITDRAGVQKTLKKYHPHLVFHAAAYKHVPLLENQLRIALYNNVFGTSVLAEECVKMQVETFVLISSDKAVNPTNIMGATKRAAEYFCQNLNNTDVNTRFITVRFGNVLDSAGSVIPLFRKQIEAGGPVTVTHPDITRFFMTIPEAAQLILQAMLLGSGGEIFVLDMGDPIKISYLAEQMIKLSGKTVGQDIKIVYTGLRPGEKLYEECFYANEELQSTSNKKILRAQSRQREFNEIQKICRDIRIACKKNNVVEEELIVLLKKLVPEYQCQFLKAHTTLYALT